MTISSSISIFFLCLPATIFSLSFDMTPIKRSDGGLLSLNGDPYINDEGLQITTNDRDKALNQRTGRARYAEALHLWDNASQKLADLSNYFSFVIDSAGNASFADGLAFFLAPLGSYTSSGSEGLGLGLGYATSLPDQPLLERFVAVEFDTFANEGIDPPNDEGLPHFGIDLNNASSVVFANWYNNITAGIQNDAWISYNSTTKILRVDFTGTFGGVTQYGNLSYEVDLRDFLPEYVAVGFSAATGDLFEKNNVRSWKFTSTDLISSKQSTNTAIPSSPPPLQVLSKDSNNKKGGLLFGLIGAGISLLIILASTSTFCIISKKNKRKKKIKEVMLEEGQSSLDDDFGKGSVPKNFRIKDLVIASNGFTEELVKGGFGVVYKGFLRATNTHVAVKKVSEGSKQGRKEYEAEVKIISQVKHKNLVELIGWWRHKETNLYIVYEYLPNGSLDSHLFKANPTLTWEMRYKIAQGLASALHCLHEQLKQYIVHRDIKASNVMLDSNFNAKLSDFGLARLVDHDKVLRSTVPAGTIGYMAPEYVVEWRASKETDVYSFGVVLLEIGSGRRPSDPRNQMGLVEWVWRLYGGGQVLDAADARLDSSETNVRKIERLMMVGLWCAHPESALRPSIKQVEQVLSFEGPLPVLPLPMPRPTYNNAMVRVEMSSPNTFYTAAAASISLSSSSSN